VFVRKGSKQADIQVESTADDVEKNADKRINT
jgi:hypothetical protein